MVATTISASTQHSTIREPFSKLKAFFNSIPGAFDSSNISSTLQLETPPAIGQENLKFLHHPFAMENGMSGIKVLGRGLITAQLRPTEKHLNIYGINKVFGGWLAAMHDAALAAAAQTLAPPNTFATTADMAFDKIPDRDTDKTVVKFIRPVEPNELLTITAKVTNPDEPVPTVISIIKRGDEVVSSAGGRFTYLKKGAA